MNESATADGQLSGFVFDVRRHGAVGDGRSLDTRAIQSAVDRCYAAGGGVVVCPPGIYLTGTIGSKDAPALDLVDVRNASIRDGRAVAGTGAFVRLSGSHSKAVALTGCDLREARCPTERGDDVLASALLEQHNLVAITQSETEK